MGNTPQNQDYDDKKKPSQDQRNDGMKETPQKPDDKRTNPADDKRGQTDRRDAQR